MNNTHEWGWQSLDNPSLPACHTTIHLWGKQRYENWLCSTLSVTIWNERIQQNKICTTSCFYFIQTIVFNTQTIIWILSQVPFIILQHCCEHWLCWLHTGVGQVRWQKCSLVNQPCVHLLLRVRSSPRWLCAWSAEELWKGLYNFFFFLRGMGSVNFKQISSLGTSHSSSLHPLWQTTLPPCYWWHMHPVCVIQITLSQICNICLNMRHFVVLFVGGGEVVGTNIRTNLHLSCTMS